MKKNNKNLKPNTMQKAILFFSIILPISVLLNAQTNQVGNFQNDYLTFLENQKTPFLKANGEVFVLDGTAWERQYGEQQYVLTPVMQNIEEYNSRIRQFDNSTTGIFKSKFHFISVEVNQLSQSLLKERNINIPGYVQGNVNVFLPEIDIDVLIQKGIALTYLKDYGTQNGSVNNLVEPLGIIWSEGFETNVVPGTYYSVLENNSIDCSWTDVSCKFHTGAYSAWCAGDGADCSDTGCGQYPDDMSCDVQRSSSINTNGYMDFFFKFWIWFDIGSNDEIFRYYDIGGGWVVSSISYTGSHSWNLAGWQQASASYTGTIPSYNWSFRFTSNAISSSEQGAYIDDLELSGTVNGINDMNTITNLNIYPNPSSGKFAVSVNNNQSPVNKMDLEIYNVLGEKMDSMSNIKHQTSNEFDLSSQPNGVYFLQVKSDNGITVQKLIIQK